MFRKHEKIVAWRAGLLAVLVHVLLVGALLISFTWKAAHTVVSVSDVELWSELPDNLPPVPPLPKINPEPPQEVEPLPEPEPVVEEVSEPEPVIEEPPKVDIELENKKKAEEEKKRLEEEAKKKELAEKEALKKKKLAEKKRKEKARRDKLRKLQAEAFDDEVVDENEKKLRDLQDQVAKGSAGAPSAATQGAIDKNIARIQAKIRGNVNSALCEGNPTLVINIKLLPTGDYGSKPKLTRSSGNAACDDAVERAVIASEPLPMPTDPGAAAAFRNLNLKFKPNG